MARRMLARSNSFSSTSRFAMPAHGAKIDKFDADGALSLVPTSTSSPQSGSFKRTPSALTQLCAISLSDDTHFALDANLAAMRDSAGRGGDEDMMMASEPSERGRADDISDAINHIDPRRRRHLREVGLGHLFG